MSKKRWYFIQFVLAVLLGIIFLILGIRVLEPFQLIAGIIIFVGGAFVLWNKYKKEKDKNKQQVSKNQDQEENIQHDQTNPNQTTSQTPVFNQTQVSQSQITNPQRRVLFGGLNRSAKVGLLAAIVGLGALSYFLITSFGFFGLGSPVGRWVWYVGSDTPGPGMSYIFDEQFIDIREDGTWTCYSKSYADNTVWIDDYGTWTKDGSYVILNGYGGPMRYRRSFNKLIDAIGTEYVKE